MATKNPIEALEQKAKTFEQSKSHFELLGQKHGKRNGPSSPVFQALIVNKLQNSAQNIIDEFKSELRPETLPGKKAEIIAKRNKINNDYRNRIDYVDLDIQRRKTEIDNFDIDLTAIKRSFTVLTWGSIGAGFEGIATTFNLVEGGNSIMLSSGFGVLSGIFLAFAPRHFANKAMKAATGEAKGLWVATAIGLSAAIFIPLGNLRQTALAMKQTLVDANHSIAMPNIATPNVITITGIALFIFFLLLETFVWCPRELWEKFRLYKKMKADLEKEVARAQMLRRNLQAKLEQCDEQLQQADQEMKFCITFVTKITNTCRENLMAYLETNLPYWNGNEPDYLRNASNATYNTTKSQS